MSRRAEKEVVALSAAGSGKGTLLARVLGSGCAGVAELLVFHPVDTVAKRLMSNQVSLEAAGGINAVVFRDAANSTFLQRWASLFPGLGFGAGCEHSARRARAIGPGRTRRRARATPA